MAVFNVSVTEAGSLADTLGRTAEFASSISERTGGPYGRGGYGRGPYGGQITDGPGSTAAFRPAITEAAPLADDPTSIANMHPAMHEAGLLADDPTSIANMHVAATAAGALSDTTRSPNNVARPNSNYQPVPILSNDALTQGVRQANAINNILAGGHNTTTTEITLLPDSATTTVNDSRVGANSYCQLMPLTSTAAAETGIYVTTAPGSITINHTNSADVTRSFRLLVIA